MTDKLPTVEEFFAQYAQFGKKPIARQDTQESKNDRPKQQVPD